MNNKNDIAVIGAGSWGTALALLLAGNGIPVRLWTWQESHAEAMRSERENSLFLPGFTFPDNIRVVHQLGEALDGVADILMVVPSHAFCDTLEAMKEHMAGHRVSWATKGLEVGSGRLLDSCVGAILGPGVHTAVVSGPTFAAEVAKGLPTAITVASRDAGFAEDMARSLHNERFRAYTTEDVIGVQIGGSVKNVLAIGAGIADGLGFGANSRSALITRGLAEVTRLGLSLGGQPETFMGLAGLGDLVLTCTDNQSRNRRMGLAIAAGGAVQTTDAATGQVVEGVRTAREVVRLARQQGVEMPISEQVLRVLDGDIGADQAGRELLTRSFRGHE